jgi:two-component system, OmpR family, response regulator RegX3
MEHKGKLDMKYFLLEDNPHEAAFFASCVAERHHETVHFERAVDLFDAIHAERPHAVVLDWMVPDVDGFVTLRRLRELCGPSLPIIMLSGLDRAEAIVQAFGVGADDYLLKPMTRAVLIARLESLMRRLGPAGSAQARPQQLVLRNGPYCIDFNAHRMEIDGTPVVLTPKELDLAWVLFNNAERFVSKAELIACVWGKRAEISPHTVTQHVYVLRSKLKLREHGYQLSAVYGSGYRLAAAPSCDAQAADRAGFEPALAPRPHVSSGVASMVIPTSGRQLHEVVQRQ